MIQQFGVIPYLKKKGEIRVVLITSASGYWIFPKGNLERHLGKRGTAELEGFEEAGVTGKIDSKICYRAILMIRGGKKAHLSLYPLKVDKLCDSWPEDSRRQREIIKLNDARRLITSSELLQCLDAFADDFDR